MSKWVYTFGDGKAEGRASDKNLLGGKGANLAEMASLGLPVPPGFTITTEVCTHYYDNKETYPADLADQVKAALGQIEQIMGATFGSKAEAGTIRGDFGVSNSFNLIHGSDSPEAAERELKLFFKDGGVLDWNRNADQWVYDMSGGKAE